MATTKRSARAATSPTKTPKPRAKRVAAGPTPKPARASKAAAPITAPVLARPQFWLVKSETEVYPYAALVAEKRTEWTGVRNYGARNALRAMNVGELVLFYHSQEDKAVVGVAKVSREAKPDPTAPDEDWSSVELVPYCAFTKPVTLAQMRAKPALADLMLLRQGRLSVMALERAHFAEIVAMSATTLPG